jgi:hypothetical protein
MLDTQSTAKLEERVYGRAVTYMDGGDIELCTSILPVNAVETVLYQGEWAFCPGILNNSGK